MKEKIFILGVGAQKCGTTWIQDFLNSYECADFGFTKEYHYFDALTMKECECFYSIAVNQVKKEIESGDRSLLDNSAALQRLAFFTNPNFYYAYFTDLLASSSIKVTGDFTPSYSGLSVETLTEIKNQFNRRGVRVVPIYLMRDPVVRLQSMARMSLKRLGGSPSFENEMDKIKTLHLSKQDLVRSNYPMTVNAIESVFGDDCFIGFYESIFTAGEVGRLCDLIGIESLNPDFNKKINVNKTENIMTEPLRTELSKGYEHVYTFCNERYGSDQMQTLWG